MKNLLLGAPVANRAWAIPHWMDCLAKQTMRPTCLLFIHSGQPHDETWQTIQREAARHDFRTLIVPDDHAPHQRHDSKRYHTLAVLRNELLEIASDKLTPTRYLSLDTDVMLEDEHTIERLSEMLDQGADLASCLTFLHPGASDPDVPVDRFWAYNAGWWLPDGQPYDHKRPWNRPGPDEIPWGETLSIDVPMAVWMCGRAVFTNCRYRYHHSGEDLGFAQDLDQHDYDCWWDTSLRADHIWQESHVRAAA